jgi:hypothetical protein
MNLIWAIFAFDKHGCEYFVAAYPTLAEAEEAEREEHSRKPGVVIEGIDPQSLSRGGRPLLYA